MKFNKLTLGIIACTLGTSIYTYQLYAGKSPQAAMEVANPQNTVSSEKKDNRVLVNNLNDAQELFNTLYKPVDKNALKNKEDLENFNKAKTSNFKFIAYLDDVLSAYQYKNIKTYKNNGEERYLVIFSHQEAVISDPSDQSSSLDLFLFKKSGEGYELIAQTEKGGLGNGMREIFDQTYNNIMNTEPLDMGNKFKGFIIDLPYGGGGDEAHIPNIIVIDEEDKKIKNINLNDEIVFSAQSWGDINPKYNFSSFYVLNEQSEHNGIYDLEVFYEGENVVGNSANHTSKIAPYNVHKTYQFNGETYKLTSEKTNNFSESSNYDGYIKHFSTFNKGGYGPIPYGSIEKFIRGDIDYWLGRGIRFYKPAKKTEEFFSWKVKGLKLFGLEVVGVERGVCNISGEDRCGYAGDTIVIFDSSVDKVRNVLKKQTFIDYAKLSSDEKGKYPELDAIDFEGKQRAALFLINENP
ncbi:hypothetical protein POD11_14265 [Acinetobacter sp. P1(2023)]|uniref:hypothetical protein n=1 Tax=unclassified Acinetobacter TaxID=196816 RepID=UPI0021CDBB9B|nr:MULTISPECIES: hypothetical protein [unclassified Acinetobacter]MCU4531338.1 hypothetical protein [Acinetobacter sp. WU_MDCI_Abxe169]MDC0843408.1 hypothetical protein [Acinetobacter sp. P1(2023)]